jgi:chromosome segregation ATPase
MTIGRLGTVRPNPKPEPGAYTDALDLLTAFGGGDKKLRKILEETHAAMVSNQALIEAADKLLGETRDRIGQAEKAEAALASRVAKENARMDKEAARLAAAAKSLQDDRTATADELAGHKAGLTVREREVLKRETAAAAKETSLLHREEDVNGREAAAEQLNASASKLKADYEKRWAELQVMFRSK